MTDANGPLPNDPIWLKRAFQDLGKAETPGPGNAAWIMAMASKFARWVREYYTMDSIPWCALFVSSCLQHAGIKAPANPLGAAAYLDWGVPSYPRRGAIVVLSRVGGSHVGFLLSVVPDPTTGRVIYRTLGGNQGDKVSVMDFSHTRVKGIRWPG